MPRRKIPFVTGEFYHLFNRSIYRQPIFTRKGDADFFSRVVSFYIQKSPPTKFSYYRRSPDKYVIQLSERLVTIISYCYMPTHFHLTVKQDEEGGVKKFMQKVSNSYSHYFRIKYGSRGSLFEATFKSVHIETDEQLIHLSRYHHLNPVTAGLVEHPGDYPFSSFNAYREGKSEMIDASYVLSNFSSIKEYEKFVMDRKQYQRELEKIKHLTLDS